MGSLDESLKRLRRAVMDQGRDLIPENEAPVLPSQGRSSLITNNSVETIPVRTATIPIDTKFQPFTTLVKPRPDSVIDRFLRWLRIKD